MDAQTFTTLAMVFAAVAIFWRRFQRTFLKPPASGCGSCTGCSGGSSEMAIKVTPLVQLGMSASHQHGTKS